MKIQSYNLILVIFSVLTSVGNLKASGADRSNVCKTELTITQRAENIISNIGLEKTPEKVLEIIQKKLKVALKEKASLDSIERLSILVKAKHLIENEISRNKQQMEKPVAPIVERPDENFTRENSGKFDKREKLYGDERHFFEEDMEEDYDQPWTLPQNKKPDMKPKTNIIPPIQESHSQPFNGRKIFNNSPKLPRVLSKIETKK